MTDSPPSGANGFQGNVQAVGVRDSKVELLESDYLSVAILDQKDFVTRFLDDGLLPGVVEPHGERFAFAIVKDSHLVHIVRPSFSASVGYAVMALKRSTAWIIPIPFRNREYSTRALGW